MAMGWMDIKHTRGKRNVYKIVFVNLKERDRSESLGAYGKRILKMILRELWEVLRWINVVQNTNRSRALIYTAIKHRVP
jgi:hypothetical protein